MPLTRLLLAALLTLVAWPAGQASGKEPERPRRLVLVVLGGGVRARDVLDPERMPTAAAWAKAGASADALVARRANAWLNLRDLLTGRADEPDAVGRVPTVNPTLFEVVRTMPGMRAEDVWWIDADASDDAGLAASTHPAYGPSVGARTARSDGAFGTPLAPFLEQMGRPLPVEEQVWPLLRRLREVNRKAAGAYLPPEVEAGLAEGERIERAVLKEIDRRAAFVKAASVSDEKATRAALTVLGVHRPRLLALRLTGAEAGQQALAGYEDALRQADASLARLLAAVQADPALAGTTAFALATEMGRNEKPAADGSLPASEESPSRRHAVLVLTGPGVKPASRPKSGAKLADVAPTLARWLGASFPAPDGRPWAECLTDR